MFGQKLKMLREKKGLTQEQFAKKFNILKSSVSMYENNVRLPNVELIKEFSNYFNVSIDYLLNNKTTSEYENELEEQEVLKKLLKRNGFMEDNEDLTDEELDKLMKFVSANKEFLKDSK